MLIFKLILTICLLFGLFVILDIMLFQGRSFDANNLFSIIWFRDLVLTASTIMGIFSQHLYTALNKTQQQSTKKIIKATLVSKSLLLSIIICPLVLAGIFKSADQIPDSFLAFIFAYQNGFFFKSIFKDKEHES